jgi:hypothetical protein
MGGARLALCQSMPSSTFRCDAIGRQCFLYTLGNGVHAHVCLLTVQQCNLRYGSLASCPVAPVATIMHGWRTGKLLVLVWT